ncbi:hypothetical protein ABID82_007316 [Methylobacterium sp. PvP062]|uniref:Uncharacterized protein n=1 Tax=Methylobacterium radiotolerans TaxID=31998 RepID=A0ABV2NP73_9HYPH|nr:MULTISPECIES: hypothetical protein [unclassified Methylobacterium]MBP2494980.1 hypothetical protein [Methylobacterium sp. PvP105]MBP2505149.1 hypothetical protein [Methylobacterium sp. PvP109]
MTLIPTLLRALAVCLQGLAFPFTSLGLACAWVAAPILVTAGWLQERAREWERRLSSRGGHTDLHPPPGA